MPKLLDTGCRYSDQNATTYRPTNENCLMRVVTSPDFCKVCIEGLWLSVLKGLAFIDDVKMNKTDQGEVEVDLDLIPLAQFSNGERPNEAYTIKWFDEKGVLMEDKTNQTYAILDAATSSFSVEIKFWTEQVRLDKENILTKRLNFTVTV